MGRQALGNHIGKEQERLDLIVYVMNPVFLA